MAEGFSVELINGAFGLAGAIAGGVFGSWEKIFPKKNQIKTTFEGYKPSDDFETNLRYYFEISGVRKSIESQVHNMLQHSREKMIEDNPEDIKKIKRYMTAIQEEAITIDESIRKLLPIYRSYFEVKELQELNKFYSTKIMQDMVRKSSDLGAESAPLQMELIDEYFARLDRRFDEINQEFDALSES